MILRCMVFFTVNVQIYFENKDTYCCSEICEELIDILKLSWCTQSEIQQAELFPWMIGLSNKGCQKHFALLPTSYAKELYWFPHTLDPKTQV